MQTRLESNLLKGCILSGSLDASSAQAKFLRQRHTNWSPYLPPCTPELQAAETLWVHLDEPIVNRHFDTLADLDAAVARQCVRLTADRDRVRGQAGFHWWPNRVAPI